MIIPSTHMRTQIAPVRWLRSTTHPLPSFCTGATQVCFPTTGFGVDKQEHTAYLPTLSLPAVLRAPHKVHSPLQVDPQFLAHYPADPGGVCTSTPETCSGRGYGTGSKGCGCDLMVSALLFESHWQP